MSSDELLSIEELKGAVNTTAKIAEELNVLLEDAYQLRGDRSQAAHQVER